MIKYLIRNSMNKNPEKIIRKRKYKELLMLDVNCLCLSNNKMKILPKIPKNIIELYCYNNKLIKLPNKIHKLYIFFFENNKFNYKVKFDNKPNIILLEISVGLKKYSYFRNYKFSYIKIKKNQLIFL